MTEHKMETYHISQLKQLEAESIYIMREVAAEFENPVMLYSVGKDSSVMLRLAQKAFAPGRIPFPMLHVDTTFKFHEMVEFRDRMADEVGFELRVHTNHEARKAGCEPYGYGTQKCCALLKTKALLDALKEGGYDAAFGGARRDEEKSRAKERVYSFRDEFGQWDPKNQRPELWNLYNSRVNKGESIRIFPLSNWTELDIWHYIYTENIPIVPLYYAKEREVLTRNGMMILKDDRISLLDGEVPEKKKIRFRTLGCVQCTGAIESEADTLEKVIAEVMTARQSERQGRAIDHDQEASMELKKREGYF
jgi:sulfate adenylyltransferase subunit 2